MKSFTAMTQWKRVGRECGISLTSIKASVILLILSFIPAYSTISSSLQSEMRVHRGYQIIYSFKEMDYIDMEIIPDINSAAWLAVILEQSSSQTNTLSILSYQGKHFERVETAGSYLNVSNCRSFKTYINFPTIYLITTRCRRPAVSVLAILDPDTLSLAVLQSFDRLTVEDAQFWNEPRTNRLNLIIISRSASPQHPSLLSHYIHIPELMHFKKVAKIKSIDPRSVTVFDIDMNTYVVVASHRSLSGNYVDSIVYVQDPNSGMLVRHQALKCRTPISFTYFCYISPDKTQYEHFIISTNNPKLKGPFKSKRTSNSIEESILFKWDGGLFVPFQTLLARLPSPWIIVQSKDEKEMLLLSWSYVDGITSYQYDGWRFRRTGLNQTSLWNFPRQMDINLPSFVSLETYSIGGETLFSISNQAHSKRKYLLAPVFQDNTETRSYYSDKQLWCQNSYMMTGIALDSVDKHSSYLSAIAQSRNLGAKEIIKYLLYSVFEPNTSSIGRYQSEGLKIMNQEVDESVTRTYQQSIVNDQEGAESFLSLDKKKLEDYIEKELSDGEEDSTAIMVSYIHDGKKKNFYIVKSNNSYYVTPKEEE